jgi:phage-related baseplate assembly protein
MANSTRFPNLVIPVIATTDYAQIAAETITEYEADFLAVQAVAKTLAPGDPVRLILLRMAARESQYRSLLNYGFQQNFILSAVGANLDAIGSNYGSLGARLGASSAITTLQFSIAAAVNADILIPVNTVVSGASSTINVTFQTVADVILTAGSTTCTVNATCTSTGTIGNGFAPGQLTSVNLSLPYIVSVTNLTTTQGGADIEGDDAYANRLALVPGAFSVAGSYQAYQYWAFTSNVAVSSVSVCGPEGDISGKNPTTAAGVVNIYAMLQGGVVPNSGVLTQMTTFLSAQTIRPLGDSVSVLAPTVTNYNIVGTYYVDPQNQNLLTTIQSQVQATLTAFNIWTSAKIGRTINPEYLGQLIMEAGASDYQLSAPTRAVLDAGHIGVQSGTMALTYGGLQNE